MSYIYADKVFISCLEVSKSLIFIAVQTHIHPFLSSHQHIRYIYTVKQLIFLTLFTLAGDIFLGKVVSRREQQTILINSLWPEKFQAGPETVALNTSRNTLITRTNISDELVGEEGFLRMFLLPCCNIN